MHKYGGRSRETLRIYCRPGRLSVIMEHASPQNEVLQFKKRMRLWNFIMLPSWQMLMHRNEKTREAYRRHYYQGTNLSKLSASLETHPYICDHIKCSARLINQLTHTLSILFKNSINKLCLLVNSAAALGNCLALYVTLIYLFIGIICKYGE